MAPVDEETQKQTRVVLCLTVQSWTSKYKVVQRRRKEISITKLQWSKIKVASLKVGTLKSN